MNSTAGCFGTVIDQEEKKIDISRAMSIYNLQIIRLNSTSRA
jgi:hypothetical protein